METINIKKAFEDVTNDRDKKAARFFNWLLKQDENADFGSLVNSNEIVFVSHQWWKIREKYPKLDNWFFNHMDMAYQSIGCCTIGFDDEYTRCDCGNIIKTTPNCWNWSPDYIQTEYEIICRDCIENDIDILIDEYSNDYKKAIPDWSIELIKEQGFQCLDNKDTEACQIFENGFHPGQDDNPETIINDLEKEGYTEKYDFLFAINSTGQFDCQFSLWIREKE